MAVPILRLGDEGFLVRELQRDLKTLGTNLEITGVFDQRTEIFVKYLQDQHGVTVDGVVGAQTWAVITRALNLPKDNVSS